MLEVANSGELLERLKDIENELEVVLSSGHRDEGTAEYIQILQEEKFKLLDKAYS